MSQLLEAEYGKFENHKTLPEYHHIICNLYDYIKSIFIIEMLVYTNWLYNVVLL